jgi:hypothetical protein
MRREPLPIEHRTLADRQLLDVYARDVGGDRRHGCRPVVRRLRGAHGSAPADRHLVVHALGVLVLGAVVPEGNTLGDQDSGVGCAVVVGEQDVRYLDRELVGARQRGERDLGFHLRSTTVAFGIVEVTGDLQEQTPVPNVLVAGYPLGAAQPTALPTGTA